MGCHGTARLHLARPEGQSRGIGTFHGAAATELATERFHIAGLGGVIELPVARSRLDGRHVCVTRETEQEAEGISVPLKQMMGNRFGRAGNPPTVCRPN
jgi:hypothetical protein